MRHLLKAAMVGAIALAAASSASGQTRTDTIVQNNAAGEQQVRDVNRDMSQRLQNQQQQQNQQLQRDNQRVGGTAPCPVGSVGC